MNSKKYGTLGLLISLTMTSGLHAQIIDWTSEGTFDASALPAGSALNSFSSSSAFDFGDVDFSHTVAANDNLSVLTLSAGTFNITAGNG